jgi:hypothetical protein
MTDPILVRTTTPSVPRPWTGSSPTPDEPTVTSPAPKPEPPNSSNAAAPPSSPPSPPAPPKPTSPAPSISTPPPSTASSEAPAPAAAPDPRTRRAHNGAQVWTTLAVTITLVLIGFTLGFYAALYLDTPPAPITLDDPTHP